MQLLPLLLQVLFLQSAEQLRVVHLIAAEVERGLVGHDIYVTCQPLSRCLAKPRSPAKLAATPLLIKVCLLNMIPCLLCDLKYTFLQLCILPALLQLPLDVEMVHPVDNLCRFLFLIYLVGMWIRVMICISELGEWHIRVVVIVVIELN